MSKHKGGGTNRYRVRYRCNACRGKSCCGTYFSFNVKEFKKKSFVVSCPCCGETERLKNVDEMRIRQYENRKTCKCGIVPFPHTNKTIGCIDYSVHPDDWTEEDHEKFQGMIETNRREDG